MARRLSTSVAYQACSASSLDQLASLQLSPNRARKYSAWRSRNSAASPSCRRRTRGSSRASRSARSREPDEALVDERLRACRGPRRRPSSAASSVQPPRKTREPAKRRCSSAVEQLVAPLDRRAQRLLALGRRRGPPVSSGSRCSSRSRSCSGESALHARGGELDRERQVVEARADLRRRASSASKSGATARARVDGRARPRPARASGGTGYSLLAGDRAAARGS